MHGCELLPILIEGDRSGCIEWPRGRDKNGYGKMRFLGRHERTHRVAFFLENGFWPNICRHVCDNPPCVNPDHLLDGTVADNNSDTISRGRHRGALITHCPKGHEYTPNNTYFENRGKYRPYRHCRICTLEFMARKYNEKKKAKT